MPQYLPLPDGTYLKLQEGETPSAGLQRAQQKYPEAFAQATPAGAGPQSGFMPALKAGATELGGGISALMGKVGLKDTAKAEAEYQAAKARAAQIFKPTEEGWAEAPLTKVGELFGGSLPYMAAPLAAGAAAAALPLTGIAGTAAALGAAGLTSAGQFTATNLARQMEGEAGSVPKRSLEQTDLSSAALAAIPQALLDTAAMRMIPGIGRLFGQAGVKVTAANAKEIAEQTLTKTLTDYALKTGKAAGIEGLTEASQQAFERLQAGLNITDEKARAEYFDSFVGGAVMGGLLSPAGRYVERSGEQRQARGLLEEESQKERKAAADAEEARKKDPTYVLEVAQEYETLNTQKADLQAQIAKGTKEAPLTQEAKDRNTVLQQQIAALEPAFKDARKKYIGLGGPDVVNKVREQQRLDAMSPEEYAEYAYEKSVAARKPSASKAAEGEEKLSADFGDLLGNYAPSEPGISQEVRDYAAAQMRTAQRMDQGGFDVADYAQFLLDNPAMAQRLVAERPAIPGFTAEESNAILDELAKQVDALGTEMATGREGAEAAAAARRAEEARRNPTLAQRELLAEGELERDAVQALARERAQAMTGRINAQENAEFRTAQQTTLLPESQQRVERTEGGERAILGRSVRERIAALEQERRELLSIQETGPTPESATLWGPLSAPSAARKRVQAIDQELTRIQKATQREGVTTTTTGMPMPLDQAQIDTRPQPKLQEQVATLLERVGTDPKTDTETQDLAARVQEQLPAVLRQLQIQSQEEAQQTRARLAGTSAAGRPVQMSAQLDPLPMVYEWAQSVRSGTPAPDLTRKLTTALQTLEQGQRSETEQVTQQAERGTTPLERSEMIGTSTEGRTTTPTRAPTGEIARASQMDLEMPEPTATSFGSFSEFAKYLASDGLAKLRRSIGLVGPTVSRIERFMQPVQQRAQRLRANETQLEQLQKSLRGASAEQRAAAEQKVRAAEYRVAIARSFMESTVAKAIAAKTLAQQKYSDALTQGVDLALQIQENYRAFAQRQADAETRELKDPFGPVAVRVGAIPARQQVADARKNFERWMDAWVRAEEHKRAVVQKHVGGDWSEGSVADREYADAKKTLDAARKDLQHARLRLSAAEKKYRAADATAATPISDNEVNEYFAKEAQLQEALKKQRRRITSLGNLAKINKDLALETYVREREAEAIALQQRLKDATPSTNIGAIIGASNDRLQKLYNNITAKGEYLISIDGQFDAFDAALKDLALAQEMQLEVVRETAPLEVRAQAAQAAATAQQAAATTLERRLRSMRDTAQQRAEQRRAPPVVAEETQSEREARDGETRKAEQARLERGERPVAGPATEVAGVYAEKGLRAQQAEGTPTARQQISFKGGIRYQAKDDQVYVALVERSTNPKLTSAQRIVVSEEADAYLAKKEAERAALEAGRPAAVAKKEGDVASAEMRIANNEAKLAEVRLSKAAEKKHQNDPATREALLEVKREKLRAEIKVDQDKLANHRRLLNEKLGYPEVTRTDPAEVRKYREKLAAEIQRSFEPGKRLGVEEGTRQRAIGPVTRDEVMPPRTMRTGTDESRTGVTTTGTSQPLQEARGVKQRDLPMKPAEMAAANEAAAAMRTVDVVDKERRDLIAKNEAAKERGYAEGEQERFVEQLAILDRRKETLKADEAALAKKKLNAAAEIAKNRSRINEINDQLAFIKANPSQTKDGQDKQVTTKNTLTMEREKLASELRELYETQTTVEKDEAAVVAAAAAKKKRGRKAKEGGLFAEEEEKTKVSPATRKKLKTAATTTVEGGVKTTRIPYAGDERFAKEEDLDNFVPEILDGEREELFLARGVEVESPDLSARQVKALESNNVQQALTLLSTDTKADSVNRAVAQRLAELLDATDVEVRDTLTDSDGKAVLGQASASGKKVSFSRAGGLTQEILLHEGTHAAAERVLAAPEASLTARQLAAKRELQALHAAVKRDPRITSANAKASLSEFVAEVMSNKNLQQQLAKKPWRMADAMRAFKSSILRLLGVKDTETMLGAAMASVDAIFQPTSVQPRKAKATRAKYSQKDIAALHDGSNSMRQFAENFPQYIKQKDRSPEDVDRIGAQYLLDMRQSLREFVAPAEPDRLDYKADTIMSDGTVFDPENPLHLVEATPTTFVALAAQKDAYLRKREAKEITEDRIEALSDMLDDVLGVDVYANTLDDAVRSGSYTLPEKALVAKAASKFGVQSTPEGRLKLVTIDANNRHSVAVVSPEAVDAIIEELRAGKNLKSAFLDGMQRIADANAERNKSKNGWQKFEVAQGASLTRLYTEEEIGDAVEQTGYDTDTFENTDVLIVQLIKDGLLPDRRGLMKTAVDEDSTEKAAIALNAGAAGTSWCTGASVSTARDQISRGDFYIYYKDGKPAVAVRMDGKDKIAEIRGNTKNQWLTPEQQEIASAFLKSSNFEGANRFLEETEKKNTLIRIFSGNAMLGDSLVFSKIIKPNSTAFDDYYARDLFSFSQLDGYAASMRPNPSAKILDNLSAEIDILAAKDMAKGYYPTVVSFIDREKGGTAKYRGREFEGIDAADVVRAESIATESLSRFSKPNEPMVFGKLQRVGAIYAFSSASFPVLKYAKSIGVGAAEGRRHVIELPDGAFVDELSPMSGDAAVEVKGGYYIKVRPVTPFGSSFSTLRAKVSAPYVTTLPFKPRYGEKGDGAPTMSVEAPNKIADAPPAEEIAAAEEERLLFARALPTASRVANALVGKEKGWVDYLRDNFLGMGFRAQFVDKLAPVEEALKKGGVSTTKALQAMYFLRMYDQRMHVTSEAMTEGVSEVVEKARKDGGTERIIQTKPGANIKKVVDILKQKAVIKAAGGADAVNNMFTLYLAAIRAERVGAQTLNFGGKVTDADLKAARAEIEADPVLKKAFGEARDIYNQYNRNLLEFSVQTGALSRDVANKLLADNDYIPYYRIRDGVAQMVIGNETPIRIGNLKDSPHLKELVKGDEAIFDFLTSSVQNTAMLLDMAMKNLATKNAMFELRDVGLATISKVPKSGKTPEGAVTFKRDGEDYFAIVDTDAIGIDSDLLVKGMAGIPTMFPAIVRLMGMPARVLRRVVVASPVYMARQLFRDSLAASMTSGANITPVLGALRQIGKADVLRGRGITGGQVFTGMPEDVTRMLKEMQAGRVGVSSGLAWLEAKSAQADALTRRAQYQSYLDQGLSEMEATFMALESMNFSKRGLSPTMHMASTLIPFFNAQIQGLDVLYKAFTGKMPMNERLAIREKLLVRGSLMFGMSIAYAMAMQDEEEYKNARPEEKYGNWFVRVPGFDEMVRLPIPFELGYVFKALPEALVNSMVNENGGEEAAKAAKHFAMQMVPGLSNYYLPQAVKPALEVALNKSIYTGRDIESAQEQMKEPGFRYRDNTTAAAREIGEFLNISPIKMEYLIRGYTGSMGMALLAAVSAPFGSDEGPQAATKRMSDMPVIGTLFQPKDASGIIDATYARMKEVNMVKETYDDLIEKGRIDDAREYLSTRTNEMALASVAGSFREYMGQIAEYERGIKASSMTPDEKREKLDAAKQMKIRLATAVRAVADKKEPPAALD